MPSYHASAQVTVPVTPAAAFAAITGDFGRWWPRAYRSHCATWSASTTGRCPRSPRSCRSPGARRSPPLWAAPARCRPRCASRGRCPRPCAAAGCPPRSSTTGSTPWTRGRAWRTGVPTSVPRTPAGPRRPCRRSRRGRSPHTCCGRPTTASPSPVGCVPGRHDAHRAERTDAAPRPRALLAGRGHPDRRPGATGLPGHRRLTLARRLQPRSRWSPQSGLRAASMRL